MKTPDKSYWYYAVHTAYKKFAENCVWEAREKIQFQLMKIL